MSKSAILKTEGMETKNYLFPPENLAFLWILISHCFSTSSYSHKEEGPKILPRVCRNLGLAREK